jgi:hypothetical protein
MKIDIGPIELSYKQFRTLCTTMILAGQGPPPYTAKQIELAAKEANTIKWKVEGMP